MNRTHKKYKQTKSIYENILRDVYPTTKVHRVNKRITKQLIHKFNSIIPHSVRTDKTEKDGLTYFELFRALSGYDYAKKRPHMVFLKGGAVRDIVEGNSIDDINDIDIMFTLPFKQAQFGKHGLNAIHTSYVYTKDVSKQYYYIKVGRDDTHSSNQSVDCTNAMLIPNDYTHYEAPLNAMFINVSQNSKYPSELDRVYDITGMGVVHAKQKIWTAPSNQTLTDSYWLKNGKLWRLIKFQLRGYTVPKQTMCRIYTFWMQNHNDVDEFNWDNVWRKLGIVDSKKHSPEHLQTKLLEFFKIVYQNFTQLQYTPKYASIFCQLLLQHNAFTVVARLKDLQKIRYHKKTLKHSKTLTRLSSRIAIDSTAHPGVKCVMNIFAKEASKNKATLQHLFNLFLLLVDIHILTTFHHLTLRYKLKPEMVSVLNPQTLLLYKRKSTHPDIWCVQPSNLEQIIESLSSLVLPKLNHIQTKHITEVTTPTQVSTAGQSSFLLVCKTILTLETVHNVFATTPIVEQLVRHSPVSCSAETDVHLLVHTSAPKSIRNHLQTVCASLDMDMQQQDTPDKYIIADTIHCQVVHNMEKTMYDYKLLDMKNMLFYVCANYI